MKTMKAAIFTREDPPVQLLDVEIPVPKPGQCRVRIKAAALNRRDYWITVGKYPGIKENVVLGSDGAGIVEKGSPEWEGKEVVINPNINWGDNPVYQGPNYTILGMPQNGTLAEFVVVDEDRLVEKPDHLSFEQAAALPLAGLTAYRAVFTRARLQKGEKALITGIGGGVSQFALAFSLAIGAKTYVTSSDKKKIVHAKNHGAVEGYNYKTPDWVESAGKSGGFDVVIDSAGGNSVSHYSKLINPGGRMVFYGSTSGRPESFDIFRLFWNQVSILGSTMGNDQEFRQMIELVNTHKINPIIDQNYPLENVYEAFRRFISPDHLGKITIKVA